jgi:hypothetical protein
VKGFLVALDIAIAAILQSSEAIASARATRVIGVQDRPAARAV